MIKQPAEQLLTASYIHVTMTCCSQAWPQAILNHDHKHINVKRVCSQGFIIRSWLHTLPFSVYFLYAFGIPSTYLPSRYFRYAFNIHAFQMLSVYPKHICLPDTFGMPSTYLPSRYFRYTFSLLSVCLPFAFGIPEHRSISVSVPGHAFSLCLCSAVLPVFLLESVGNRNSRDGYSGDRGNGGDNDDHSLHI